MPTKNTIRQNRIWKFCIDMIKVFYDTEINKDTLERISEVISNSNDNIEIYLCSIGGSEWCSSVIIDMINNNKDRIELIGYGYLLSAAFHIMMESKCKKRILDNTYGMYHQSVWDIEVSALNKPSNLLDKFRVEKIIKEYKIYYENKCKEWGLNEQELKKYKKGEDVYFSYERFQEIINHTLQS